jgi:hypothetical protein
MANKVRSVAAASVGPSQRDRKSGRQALAYAAAPDGAGTAERRELLSAALVAGTVVLVVAVTNLLWPHAYRIFAWDYPSYFSIGTQLLFALGAMGLLLGAWGAAGRRRLNPTALLTIMVAASALLVASFFVFATPYPRIAGDGEYGRGVITMTRRLPNYLAQVLADNVLHRDLCAVWIAQERIFAGLYLVMVLAVVVWLRQEAWTALGMGCFLLANPMLLNAYGHYDSYAATLATSAGFWLALNALDRATTTRAKVLIGCVTTVALGLAVWTHPIHGVLLCAFLWYGGIRFVAWRFPVLTPNWALLALPVVLALGAALALVFKFPDYIWRPNVSIGYHPLQGDFLGWFIHSKSMDYLTVALTGIVLLAWLVLFQKPWRMKQGALTSCALFALLTALLCSYTLPYRQGINDEFARCVIGMLTLGPAVTLLLAWCEGRRRLAIVAFAVLAAYLYVPRMAVYGSERYIERLRALYPYDRCGHNSQMSAYVHLGLILPSDSEFARQSRLTVFAEGTQATLPYWQPFRLLNLMYYTAWCYEFNEDKKGQAALGAVLRYAPQNLPALMADGAMFTGRDGHNNAYRKIRRDAKVLLAEMEQGKGDTIYGQLRRYIDQLETKAPSQ